MTASSSGESGANSQTRLSHSMMTSALGLFAGRCGIEVSALGAADAVIHDLEIPDEILERVKPPRYRDAVFPADR